MKVKYIVWIKCRFDDCGDKVENPVWEPNGDGPMTSKTAERVAREIREDFGVRCQAKFLPVGEEPFV